MGAFEFLKFICYKPETKTINCLKYNPTNHKLALSRSNHCNKPNVCESNDCCRNNIIEIIDVKQNPNLDRIIIVNENDSVESMCWCGDRLFSAGYGGSVTEYDLNTCNVKQDFAVTSGPCWCLDISGDGNYLAAGTEDGYVNVVDIGEGTLEYNKLFEKQQGRILSIAWEKTGQYLVTGSQDAIRIWNVETGHAIHKLIPGRIESNKPTVVWCLAVTSDFTIISGDSRGRVTFWDGKMGMQLDSHQSHKADILTMCLDENSSKLYCAGVDPLIASFERINIRVSGVDGGENYKWVKSIQRIIHDHCVRALAICEDKLYSGGIDGYLALSSYPPKIVVKYSSLLQPKRVCSAAAARVLLLTYDQHLEIWQWSPTPAANPYYVANVESPRKKFIRSACLSPDGRWISYSTDFRISILKLPDLPLTCEKDFDEVKENATVEDAESDLEDGVKKKRRKKKAKKLAALQREAMKIVNDDKKVVKISGLPTELKSATICHKFSTDSQYLAAADRDSRIVVVKMNDDDSVTLINILNADRKVLTDIIHIINFSTDNKYIVVADRSGNIAVWNNFEFHCSLPRSIYAPTAMAINSDQNSVVVSYADHKIVEFDLEKKRYTEFSRKLDRRHPKQWLSRQFSVEGILFDKNNSNVMMIYDDTSICVIDKTKKLQEANFKIPRLELVSSTENSENSESNSSHMILNGSGDNIAFHVLKEYKHLVYLDAFNERQIVAVEVEPDSLANKLPLYLFRKRFGVL